METDAVAIAAAAAATIEPLDGQVFLSTEDVLLVLTFIEVDASTSKTWAPLSNLYASTPYQFSATDRTGKPPRFPTFGSLLACHEGILTYGPTRYLIQVQQRPSLQSQSRTVSFAASVQHEPQGKRYLDSDEARQLKKMIVEIATKDSKAVSYSNYFEEKCEEDRVEMWHPQLTSSFELPAFLEQAAAHTGSEKDVVKPFWKNLLDQHAIVPDFSNAYEAANLGPKFPDIAIFSRGVAKPLASNFVAAGDCKGSTWKGSSSSEIGQIMLYLHRMLDAQPTRQFAYGFVTNNCIMVLIKSYREQDAPFMVRWCISGIMNFDYGMKLWMQLMQEDSGYHNPPVVGNFPITFKDTLRPGGSCRAFVALYRGKPVVAKLYKDQDVALESATLTTTAARVVAEANGTRMFARIPEVVINEGNWCLISPKGRPLTRENFVRVHVEQIINTLQVIHQAGIVHRDVRVSNIFWLDDEQVLLNDWGSSVTVGETVLYAGAPEPHIHPQIPLTDLYSPAAKHDLFSLVSSVAQLLAPGVNIESRLLVFKEAFDSAEVCDYAGVTSKLACFMKC